MNRMDKLSKEGSDQQIFAPIPLMEPKLYYNPLMNENLLLGGQTSNNSKNNKNLNLSQPKISKKNKKNKTSIEISLISLLNAISDLSSKELNTNTNSKKDISIKNDSFSSDSEKQGDSYAVMELLTQKTKRNQKYCNACPHHNAPHYAKGMCSNCYHSRGRKKKPWNCPHANKFHYALGLCQNCYQMRYMKKQNDDGIKIIQTSSNLELEDFSNNSITENKEKTKPITKRGKSCSNRHSKKKLINI